MLHDRTNLLLRAEAAELADGGGDAPVLALLPDPVAAVDPAAEVREPSLLEKARAAFQSKAAILAEANDAQAQLADAQRLITGLQADKADLLASVAALQGELATLRTERTEIGKLLDSAKAEKASAEEKAADIVAAVGFPAAQLPAAEHEMAKTRDELLADLTAATDPKEKFRINQLISAL